MATNIWQGTTNGTWSTTTNWSLGSIPANGDTVYLAGNVAITGGLSTGLTGINLIVDPGYTGTIASSAAYLSLACASFNFAGTGNAFIDLGSSAITASVTQTGTGTATSAALYLKGSALSVLAVSGTCSVALAGLDGETSTVTTARVAGAQAKLLLGAGVTLTTAQVSAGALTVNCAATTLNIYSGACTTNGTGAITTVSIFQGTAQLNSTGTITTLNANAGTVDFTKFPVARTVSAIKLGTGGVNLSYDPAILTVTAWTAPASPIRLTATAA